MTLVYTPIFAALVAFLLLTLWTRVILYRRANRVSLGDAGDPVLLRLMRAQSNCTEYAPIALLLLLVLELQGWSGVTLAALGLMLVAGRLIHAYGFSGTPEKLNMRIAGMALTLTMVAVSATFALIGVVLP
jgi:uncharacterized membrane protein YecN with MAPEG domain